MQDIPEEREENMGAQDLLNTRFGTGYIHDEELIFTNNDAPERP